MNLDKSIKSVLESATSVKVYPIKKPVSAAVPCIVYRRVSNNEVISHAGDEGCPKDRIQIMCLHTTYTGLRTLVGQVEGALIANTTNWEVSLPAGNKFEDYDEEDKVYSCSNDYFIRYSK